jgi:serine/threonine protein kinase/Tfp pilus assembly protein PilF
MIGEQLGHYRIERKLGTGGMGVVYRAWDERLERFVAIKLLASDDDGPKNGHARVLREARAASALSHPGICTVFEVGEAGGRAYIVMELVDGRPLADAIPPGGMPTEDVVQLGRQIAQALAHAHERGIVHRDLKSSNVIVTPEGRTKLLDFGIAARTRPELEAVTRSRGAAGDEPAIAGTLAYMAPEVLQGHPADARSDIWMAGVLLYEMAAGVRPFGGATAFELSTRILRDAAPPLPHRVPAALGAVIRRCLSKSPAQRYGRGAELEAALEAIADDARQPATRAPIGSRRAIAVLPFRDLSSDPDDAHLGLGLADATITELALVRSLLVRPTSSILSYADGPADPLAAANALGVDAIVAGTFQRAGTRLRVTVQLIDAADGRSLWGTKVNTTFEDIFQLQDEVSRQIARALEVELTASDEGRLGQSGPVARPAYEQYLKGRVLLLNERLDTVNEAIECFERVLEIEPGFAQAYAGLADAYARLAFTFMPEGDWHARAQAMCDRALALDPSLPEGRYLRGKLLWSPKGGFDHAGAIREFLSATAARPNLNEAHDWLGIVLFHVAMLDEAPRRFERALAINPDDLVALLHLGFCRYLEGDFRVALEISEEAARRAPSYWASYQIALAQVQLGLLDKADRTLEQASRSYAGNVLAYPIRGIIAALQGDAGRARQQVELTVANHKSYGHYHHAQYDIACIYAQIGEPDEAMTWMEAAARNGFPCYRFFERDALLAPARTQPRFATLMDELRTECDGYRKLYRELTPSKSWT